MLAPDAAKPEASARGAAPDGVVRLLGVRKAFGSQVVLDGVDLAIQRAKTTVVMGPSGCGKSVMLKHIIGLLRPDAGEVWYEDRRVDTRSETDLFPIRLEVSLVFQMGALFDSMSVMENIEFPLLEQTRLTPAQRRARVREALETVDLAAVEEKLPSQLSGGQRKRVALARAIVLRPKVVLYDEPTTGLDPIRSDGINELIIKLQRTMQVTNIVVTHDLTSARKIADRVVMLLGGRIAADGTFEQLERSPDRRVQHFLKGQYDRSDDAALTATELEGKRQATLQ